MFEGLRKNMGHQPLVEQQQNPNINPGLSGWFIWMSFNQVFQEEYFEISSHKLNQRANLNFNE